MGEIQGYNPQTFEEHSENLEVKKYINKLEAGNPEKNAAALRPLVESVEVNDKAEVTAEGAKVVDKIAGQLSELEPGQRTDVLRLLQKLGGNEKYDAALRAINEKFES